MVCTTISLLFIFCKGSEKLERGRIYHNFYTEELWSQVNKENKNIMERFSPRI